MGGHATVARLAEFRSQTASLAAADLEYGTTPMTFLLRNHAAVAAGVVRALGHSTLVSG
jgi:hypothetical protein